MRIRIKRGFLPADGFEIYLVLVTLINQYIKDKRIKFSYLSILFYLRFQSSVNCTSILPGHFRPYKLEWRRYYIHQVYSYALQYLVKHEYLIQHGRDYKFTAKAETLFRSFTNQYLKHLREYGLVDLSQRPA